MEIVVTATVSPFSATCILGDDLFVMVQLSSEKAKKACTVKVPSLDRGKVR